MDSSKTFVVTGAGRGIGRDLCLQLVHRGHRVLAAVRTADAVEALKAELGATAVVTACDVRDAKQVQKLFTLADERFGAVDGLVNNAATVQPIGRIAEVSTEDWQQSVLANLYGPYLCIAQALPRLTARGGGIVVNLSSGAARRAMEGWSAYCATKAGLAMLTRSVHEEYHALGVCAVGLAPGTVDTDMQAAIRGSGINPVSRIERAALSPPEFPARMIVATLEGVGRQFAGQEVDVRDEAFRLACEAELAKR
jgi:NAD(P)-dependent dehydrogenase (short-subunit alcohol dehydrogenase family)